MRVVALGLDAAEWWYVEQLIDRGDMPALGALLARSRHGLIDAQSPRNEFVWAEFVAGGDPGRPYDWDTHRLDPMTYESYLYDAQPGARFWTGATRGRVITLDVPRVTAAEGRDTDVHVVGWGAAQVYGPRSSTPRGLLRDIDARFGPHPMVRNDQMGWHHARRIDDVTREMVRGARLRPSIARYLLDRFPDWELFVTVWSEMHPGAEFLWHGVDRGHLLHQHPTARLAAVSLRRIYRAVDAAIGEFVATLPDDVAVVVFSLNGVSSGPGDTASGVLLPEFLSRLYAGESLLDDGADAWRRRGYVPVQPGPCQRGGYFTQHRRNASTKARLAQQVLARLPEAVWPVQDRVRKAGARVAQRAVGPLGMTIPPEEDVTAASLDALRTPFHQVAEWYRPLWPKMPAFALPSFAMGYVRCNVMGREARGMVMVDNYEAFLETLGTELRRLTSPRTGAPVVRDVLGTRGASTAEILDPEGPYADAIVLWENSVDAIEHPATGVIGPFPLQRLAGHTPHGFALVAAPGVTPAGTGHHAPVALPATILALLGSPVEAPTLLDAPDRHTEVVDAR